jgi:hypothetical protein
VGARRRPRRRATGARAPEVAADLLALRLVAEEPPRLNIGRVSEQLVLGGLRRPPPPFTVEILERDTERLIGAQSVPGTRAEANGVYLMMKADLGRMAPKAFLRKWGRRVR